uniref:Uncharacterized protein n=1 Tax=Phlebotomus papatasi TaxID=29031 RepID=A0A1B0DR46_PHLPP
MARKCGKKECSVESAENISLGECYNTVKNDAAFRGILLKQADELYRAGKHMESIECQIEALCLGFRTKFFFCDYSSFDSGKYLENLLEAVFKG